MKQTLILAELKTKGIELRLDGEELVCSAPAGTLDPALQRSLAEMKADLVAVLRRREAMPARETVRRLDEADQVPLSFNQQRLWFLDQLNPGQCGYVMIRGFRIQGDFDAGLLRKALQFIVRRHRILATRICVEKEEPLQIEVPEPEITVSEERFDGGSDEEWGEWIAASAAAAGRQPFDISSETLVRARLLSRSDREHVLLLTMHHIAADDWSWSIFLEELTASYAAIARGEEPRFPELPIDYADYAAHQRASVATPKVRQQLEYWKGKLWGNLPSLDFPLDHPRPKMQTDRGARMRFSIPNEQKKALQALAIREGATLFMALLAVYKVLLHRYTGQEDIIVGTPIANRNLVETTPLVGFFANTLAIRSIVEDEKTFTELLKEVRNNCLEAYENQDVPFEHIVEHVNPPRDLSRPPIFDVQFALRNVPREAITAPGLEMEEIDVDPATSKFDMFFFLREEEGELTVTIEYNSDLFLASTIERLGKAYLLLVENAVRHASSPIGRIPILGSEEREYQVRELNRTEREFSEGATLHALVTRQAERSPDKAAVRFGDEVLSYAELQARAGAVAAELSARSVGPGDFVGVFVERSEHMVPALLGVLQTGAAYVPLDPYYPRDRIAYIVEDAGLRAVVTDEHHENDARQLHDVIVRCDTGASADYKVAAGGDPGADKAYVIYTSGSTGKPKGVAVTHRNVVNFLESMAESPGLDEADRLLAVTTLSFDISILEVFLPLVCGATVHLLSRDDALDPVAISSAIDTQEITVMQATPATWEMLLATGWKGSSTLRVLCGGESFPRKLANALLDVVPEVWNMYGPTETTIWSSIARVEASERSVPIGRPIANTAMYVLDPNLEPVPLGAVGELYIGGSGVAAGYLNRDELTRERFLPDPFDGSDGARIYRSGDLARYREDGQLECLGRVDTQVKIRGFRIELGEIETALEAHDKVVQAVVTAARGAREGGYDTLVAHYILHEPRIVTHTELRAHLRGGLPEYMVPQFYNEMEEFPLTPNHKVDRIALSRYEPPSQHVEVPVPETESEQYLALVWQDILGVQQVGRYDFFFEVGGHSLLAAQMVARVGNEKGVRIPLRDIIVSNLSEVAATHLDAGVEMPKKQGLVKRLLDKVL